MHANVFSVLRQWFANIQGPEARVQVSVYSGQVQVSEGQGLEVNAKMEGPPSLPSGAIPIWEKMGLSPFFGSRPFVIVSSLAGADCCV